MDTSVAGIRFDDSGVCSYCAEFVESFSQILFEPAAERKARLTRFVDAVKKAGKGKQYDCVVGVSGGVDSSWVLVKAVELGLRPLAVHMDNGWNSELAQNNIANLIGALDLDLFTHVIDWEEYRGMMQAFFDAGVVDIELLYDNAMLAVNFHQAAKFNVDYILSGSNKTSEGIRMPQEWAWHKYDFRNIKSIVRSHGGPRLSTFPGIGTVGRAWHEVVRGRRWVAFLDMLEYDKQEAMAILSEKYMYKPYPYKHYESVFTRFYQGYILPAKFGIDKRRLHFSTLIAAGQLDREQALNDLESIPYPSEQHLEDDKRYFLKKMRWGPDDLEAYINRPRVGHDAYLSERVWYERLYGLYKLAKGD